MQIVSLLNGENINQDHQLTALAKATLHAGVISGLQVSAGSVAIGEAFIECTRSNGEKIMVLFQNTSVLNLNTSWNGKIFIEINQENIDNGVLNAEDGSNIGQIKKASAYPVKNFVPLASVSNGQITDERKFIQKKVLDARTLTRTPRDYFTPNHGGFSEITEFNNKNYLGLSHSANNYHTVYTTAWRDNTAKPTQIAYSAWEIWMRTGRTETEWNEWQKVYPFTASALDIGGLGNATWNNPSDATSFLMRDPNTGLNNRVELSKLRQWIFGNAGNSGSSVSTFCTVYTNMGTSSSGDVTLRQSNGSEWKQSTGTVVNASGICSIHGNPRWSNAMDYYIDYSTNNSTWTEWRKNPTIGEVFYAPAGFWRVRIVRKQHDYPYDYVTVKLIFSK